VETGLAAAV
jgi:hypothetical protein